DPGGPLRPLFLHVGDDRAHLVHRAAELGDDVVGPLENVLHLLLLVAAVARVREQRGRGLLANDVLVRADLAPLADAREVDDARSSKERRQQFGPRALAQRDGSLDADGDADGRGVAVVVLVPSERLDDAGVAPADANLRALLKPRDALAEAKADAVVV